MQHFSSFAMSITLSNFLSISTGSNHEANDCEVKTPHIEEHRVWNDDAPVEPEANACADDDPVGDDANACAVIDVNGIVETIGTVFAQVSSITFPSGTVFAKISFITFPSSMPFPCRPVLRFSGSCLGKSPGLKNNRTFSLAHRSTSSCDNPAA